MAVGRWLVPFELLPLARYVLVALALVAVWFVVRNLPFAPFTALKV